MPSKTYPVLAPVTCSSILIQQSRSLSFQLSANHLCVSEREHIVGVLQLFPGRLGHQQLAHCVVGHIVAVDTSSQSIDKKSINTRERRTILSAYRIYISLPVKSLICATRMSMHEWYSRVRRSARHSDVWATVAALLMPGIIPRSRQA